MSTKKKGNKFDEKSEECMIIGYAVYCTAARTDLINTQKQLRDLKWDSWRNMTTEQAWHILRNPN
jgi:hypothetical protein